MELEYEVNEPFMPLYDVNDLRLNYCYIGGRDGTKSWEIAQATTIIAFTSKVSIMCVKGTMNSIKDSVKKLIENTIERLNLSDYFDITRDSIVCTKTGSEFIFKGMQKAERLKSTEGVDWVWIEEANVDTDEQTFDDFLPTIRKEGSKIIWSFNPKTKDEYVYDRFVNHADKDDLVRFVTYKNNKWLSTRSKKTIRRQRELNYHKYKHIYLGEPLSDDSLACFKLKNIHCLSPENSINVKENFSTVFDKIIVSVDPSGSNHIKSDACGIVVIGKYSHQERYCVIDDQTAVLDSSEWARASVNLYNKYKADVLVYERNYGGNMTRTIIKQIDKSVYVEDVWASKGKEARTAPAQSVYEQDLVDHVQGLDPLETEMTTWRKDSGMKSPNRLDALVWGITWFVDSLKKTPGVPDISFY